MNEKTNPFTPLTADYKYKDYTFSFKDICNMDTILQNWETDSIEYKLVNNVCSTCNISHDQMSRMAERCRDVEIAALKALITLDMTALGEYGETSGDAFMWTLHHGENWSIEESWAGKVAFVMYKIHFDKAKMHNWSDVKVAGKELKKYSDILDNLEDDKEY